MPEEPTKYVFWIWDKGQFKTATKFGSGIRSMTYIETDALEKMRLAAEDIAQRCRDELDTRYDRKKP